jgi:hypothetical protein
MLHWKGQLLNYEVDFYPKDAIFNYDSQQPTFVSLILVPLSSSTHYIGKIIILFCTYTKLEKQLSDKMI